MKKFLHELTDFSDLDDIWPPERSAGEEAFTALLFVIVLILGFALYIAFTAQ